MRGARIAAVCLGFILLLSGTARLGRAGEVPHLLADIDKSPAAWDAASLSEEPAGFFNLGDRLLFSTANPRNQDRGILWSTDGTAPGTVQVSAALCPSPCSNILPKGAWQGIELLGVDVGDPYVSLTYRLGRTDGTPAGTFLLTDSIFAGPFFGPPDFFYFQRCSTDFSSCSIWRSDGTLAGTVPVPVPFDYGLHSFAVWGSRLCFIGSRQGQSYGLWCSDGTAGGTVFLADFTESYGSYARLVATPSHLFFTAGETGEDLWVTDGTPGSARRLADFAPVPCDHDGCLEPDVDSLLADGDGVYFATSRGERPAAIWHSDGTEAETRPQIELPAEILAVSGLRHIGDRWVFYASKGPTAALWTAGVGFAGAAPLASCGGESCPAAGEYLTAPGPGLQLFAGEDPDHGIEPWVMDGTAAGTRRLADTCPGPCPGFRIQNGLPSWQDGASGRIWFRAYAADDAADDTGDQLWVTDGTPAGTRRAAGHASDVGFLGGLAWFGSGHPKRPASELWATDGTPGHARRVSVLRRFAAGSFAAIHPLGEGALLEAYDTDGDFQLWRSDGTPEGTAPIAGLAFDRDFGFASLLAPVGPLQFFQAARARGNTAGHTRSEVWRTDGTERGTLEVAELGPRESVWTSAAWNGRLVLALTGPGGCSFWSSDGTAAGTGPLLPHLPGVRCPTVIVDLGPRFLFVARVGANRRFTPQVFISDGTLAGTRQVSAIQGAREPLDDEVGYRIGGTVYFRIYSPFADDPELWRTDGTAEGTRRISPYFAVGDLHAFQGSLYFTALLSPEDATGRKLFRVSSPGSFPVLLATVNPQSGDAFSSPLQLAPAGDRLLFGATDPQQGPGLWITDGTPAGTHPLLALAPGAAGLASDGRRVFFAADDGAHGWELWQSDGTAEGTRQVADLAPGGFSSSPANLVLSGGYLFFTADDGQTGGEPWALKLEP